MARLVGLFVGLLLASSAAAYNIVLEPHETQCYHEDLKVGNNFGVTFQVSDGGNLDVDFWMSDPDNRLLHHLERESTGSFTVSAQANGKYTFCFSNQMSTMTTKTLAFNTHLHVEEKPKEGEDDIVDPMMREVRLLSERIAQVRDEQQYLVVRERVHRNTAESTNSRVLWWSIFETAMLIGVCVFQVMYLKRFFEVKRTV